MYNLTEKNLRYNKVEKEYDKFKIGDFVKIYHGPFYQSKAEEKCVVKKIFSYDDDPEIYCYINGYYKSTMLAENLTKCRDPLIIFSAEDPYGEEDWGEE